MEDEQLETVAVLDLHHPVDYNIRRTLGRDELSRIERLAIELPRHGADSPLEDTFDRMRQRRDHDLECLDDGVKRMVNPHLYHVSLTGRLWELKQQLMRERSFPAGK